VNIDIRVSLGFFDHRKTRRLARELGPDAPLRLIQLWCWTARHAPTGVLVDITIDEIEAAAAWRGEAGKFHSAIRRIKFLDRQGRHWAIHDWVDWNPYAAEEPNRVEDGRMGAHIRHHVQKGISKPDTCRFCRGAAGDEEPVQETLAFKVSPPNGRAISPPSGDGIAPYTVHPAPGPDTGGEPFKQTHTSTNARAREDGGIPSMAAFLYYVDLRRKFHAKPGVDALRSANADLYAGEHTRFVGCSPEAFDAMEQAVINFGGMPPSCRDGHHFFDRGSNKCAYCPFLRVGEVISKAKG
jgi:hypothetical protein